VPYQTFRCDEHIKSLEDFNPQSEFRNPQWEGGVIPPLASTTSDAAERRNTRETRIP